MSSANDITSYGRAAVILVVVTSRHARRFAAAIVLIATSGACGLAVVGTGGGALPDEDGGGAEASAADAPVSADGSGGGDATVDALSSLDAASTDADAGAVDAPFDSGTFCATLSPAPTFCADFDYPADASAGDGWNYTIQEAGAAVTLTATAAKSAPRSMQSKSTLGGAGSVSLTFSLVDKISVDFDVQYLTPIPDSGVTSPILLTTPTFPGQDIYFYAGWFGSYFQEYGNDYSPNLVSPPIGVWHHVSIVVQNVDAGVTNITASMDGNAAWTNHALKQAWPSPTTATLQIGLPALYQVGVTQDVLVDNVVVRVN
jgi:hypothetical protein